MTVLLGHYTALYDHLHGLDYSLGFHFWIGGYGVLLFFVISGFVIDLTLHRCRTGLDFVVSRFSRIFPAYWGALLVTFAALHLLRFTAPPTLVQLAVGFTMLERFFGLPHLDQVYWTLNVELSFYLWMLLIFKLGALGRMERIIPFVLAFQWAVETCSRHVGHTFSQGADVVFLLEYAHLFCAGMLFYRIWDDRRFTVGRAVLLMWCYFNHAIVNFRWFYWDPPPVYALGAVLAVFAIMLLVIYGRLRRLAAPPLLYLGTISYTLYLLHDQIGLALRELPARHGIFAWPGFLAAVVLVFTLASLLTFLVEKPAMRRLRSEYKKWRPEGRP